MIRLLIFQNKFYKNFYTLLFRFPQVGEFRSEDKGSYFFYNDDYQRQYNQPGYSQQHNDMHSVRVSLTVLVIKF